MNGSTQESAGSSKPSYTPTTTTTTATMTRARKQLALTEVNGGGGFEFNSRVIPHENRDNVKGVSRSRSRGTGRGRGGTARGTWRGKENYNCRNLLSETL